MRTSLDHTGILQLHHQYLSVSRQFDQAIADRSAPEYLRELLQEMETIIDLLETQAGQRKQLRLDM